MAHGLSCSTACGMWDLPRPGIEPVSPALAGGFLTTAPPGKPPTTIGFLSQAFWVLLPLVYILGAGVPHVGCQYLASPGAAPVWCDPSLMYVRGWVFW